MLKLLIVSSHTFVLRGQTADNRLHTAAREVGSQDATRPCNTIIKIHRHARGILGSDAIRLSTCKALRTRVLGSATQTVAVGETPVMLRLRICQKVGGLAWRHAHINSEKHHPGLELPEP